MTLKRITAFTVSLLICLLSVVPVFAAEPPRIEVGEARANPGDTVSINVDFINNPGICTFTMEFNYNSDVLTLVSVTPSEKLSGEFNFSKNATWLNSADTEQNGTFLTLVYKVKETAPSGDYSIGVSYNPSNICNFDEENVAFQTVSGKISVRSETDPEIKIATVNANASSSVDVDVSFINNPGICTFAVEFIYDSAALTLESVSFNESLGGNFNYSKKAVWINLKDITFSGTVMTLKFKVSPDAAPGEYIIRAKYASGDIGNYSENDVFFYASDGAVCVIKTPTIMGDVNGDGKVTAADANIMKKMVTGKIASTSVADLNGDNKVTAIDVNLVKKLIVGSK